MLAVVVARSGKNRPVTERVAGSCTAQVDAMGVDNINDVMPYTSFYVRDEILFLNNYVNNIFIFPRK
jgi:hypothetical protein